MAAIVLNRTTKLDSTIRETLGDDLVFTNEQNAHKFVIQCTLNNSHINLTGTVTAQFICPDNATVTINGTIENGKAVVTLPVECYEVPGRFRLSVFNTQGDATVCIYTVVGTIRRTSTGKVVDRGIIPNLNELQQAAQNIAGVKNIDITQTKSGNVITVTTTDRNNVQTNKTITEPTATMSKAENGDYTITVTDANGSTSYTIEDTETAVRKKATIDAVSKVKTALGNPLTITDGMDAPAVKTVVALEPKQDLHGYDHPWVGGSGKNLIPSVIANSTRSGITCTRNDDGTIVLNGTATEMIDFYPTHESGYPVGKSGGFVVPAGTYSFGSVTGGSSTTYRVYLVKWVGSATTATYNSSTNGEATITLSEETTIDFFVRVDSGVTLNNLVISPMVRLSSTESGYAPYSNICPIEGFDTVRVTATGKNLFDVSQIEIGKNWLHGNAANRAAFAVQTVKGSTLNIMAAQRGDTRRVVIVGANKFGSNAQQSFNKNFQPSIAEIQHTVTADEYAIVQFERLDGGAVTQEDIDCWDIAISYMDINTTSLSVAQAAGATVYCGTVTLNEDGSGTLVVDSAKISFAGKTWVANGTFANTYSIVVTNDNPRHAVDDNLLKASLSNKYIWYNSATVGNMDYGFGMSINNDLQFYVKDKDIATVEEANSKLSDLEISYPLHYPVSYNLTSTQLRTLTGKNHVWTDGTKLELTYRADKYADVEKFLNAIPTGTKTGDPAVFADGADDLPFEKLTIAVEPHQEGSGDPSPDNIRPITGWDEVKVTRCGKNLCPGSVKSETAFGLTTTVQSDGTFLLTGKYERTQATTYYDATKAVTLQAGTYTLSGTPSNTYGIALRILTATKVNLVTGNTHFTLAEPTEIQVAMYVPASMNGTTLPAAGLTFSPMVSAGSESSPTYEPYVAPTTLPISLKYATGSTVYGGTVTINRDGTGSVVVDRAIRAMKGSEFTVYGAAGTAPALIRTPSSLDNDRYDINKGISACNAYRIISTTPSQSDVNTIRYNPNGYIYVFDNSFTDLATGQAKIDSIGLQLVLYLATPETYTLTAPQLTSLLGNNTVWCDAGQVTVKYKRDIGKALDAMVASLIEAGLYVDMGQVVVEPGA